MYLEGSAKVYMQHVNFESCDANLNGGGLYCDNDDYVRIFDSTIVACSGVSGGGIYVRLDTDMQLIRSHLTRNAATNGGGLFCDGGMVTAKKIAFTCFFFFIHF